MPKIAAGLIVAAVVYHGAGGHDWSGAPPFETVTYVDPSKPSRDLAVDDNQRAESRAQPLPAGESRTRKQRVRTTSSAAVAAPSVNAACGRSPEIVWCPDADRRKPFDVIPTEWTTRTQVLPGTWGAKTVFASGDGEQRRASR